MGASLIRIDVLTRINQTRIISRLQDMTVKNQRT
jgi:hypothetical protein